MSFSRLEFCQQEVHLCFCMLCAFSNTMHIHISSEFRTLEHILPIPQHRVACSMKSVGRLCEPVPPLADLPLSQAKEMDHLSSPCLLKDDDWKDSSGRVRAVGRGEQVSFSMSVIASVTKCH